MATTSAGRQRPARSPYRIALASREATQDKGGMRGPDIPYLGQPPTYLTSPPDSTGDGGVSAPSEVHPAPNVELGVEPQPLRRGARPRHTVTAMVGGTAVHVDTFELTDDRSRSRFVNRLAEKMEDVDSRFDADAIEAELIRLASEAAAPLVPDNQTEEIDEPPFEADAVLGAFELNVLAEGEDQSIALWCRSTRKRITLGNARSLNRERLFQAAGSIAEDRLRDEGDEPRPDAYSLAEVRKAIALRASAAPRLGDDTFLGQGVWPVDDGLLIVDGERGWRYDGAELHRLTHPRIGKQVIDFQPGQQWHGAIEDELSDMTPEKAQGTLLQLRRLMSRWNWTHRWDPYLAASLVSATFVQACWSWRPLVSVNGASDTGKSTLMSEVLAPVLLPWTMLADRSTEAGLRQALGNDSCPVLIDEFDRYRHRQDVLELFRTASRGGMVLRGSGDQGGRHFQVRHLPWFAAIESGDIWAQDRNRFIRLELDRPRNRGQLSIPGPTELGQLGRQVAAAAIWAAQRAVIIADAIKSARVTGVPGRVVESCSVPAAMLIVLMRGRAAAASSAETAMRLMLKDRASLQEQGEPDEIRLLNDILSVNLGGGSTVRSVSQLLNIDARDHRELLAAKGVKLVKTREGQRLFLVDDVVRQQLLKGTRWANSPIGDVLLRIRGAQRSQQRISLMRPWGILLPWPDCLGEDEREQDSESPPVEKS